MVQFSMRWLLAIVTLIAVAAVAMLNANQWWTSYLFFFAVLFFFVAILGALFSVDRRRAYWTGVAIFGWGYLLVLHLLHEPQYLFPVHSTVQAIYPALSHEVELPRNMSPGSPEFSRIDGYRSDGSPVYVVRKPHLQTIVTVAHSFVAVLFALTGGWIAGFFHRGRTISANASKLS